MGKTSNYERRPRDFYKTPEKAVLPLLDHLPKGFSFCEPCAGDGQLANFLEKHFDAMCFLALDIEPQVEWVLHGDSVNLNAESVEVCDYIITNPPFKWVWLKPLMDRWIDLKPTILLLPADFAHNLRFTPYLDVCTKIVSVGRVKWIEDSTASGVENYSWYFFDKNNNKPTEFYGRTKDGR